MSDDITPEKLRAKFKVIRGGLDVDPLSALPEKLKDKVFTLADLSDWNLSFEFKETQKPCDIEEIIIDGVTVYVKRIKEAAIFYDDVLDDPMSDTFVFDTRLRPFP